MSSTGSRIAVKLKCGTYIAEIILTTISVGFTILATCGYAMNIWEVMK